MEQKKIPLGKLIRVKDVFSPHYAEKISVKLAFKLFRVCTEAEKVEKFRNEKLRAILDECAEKDSKGEYIRTEDGNGIRLIPSKTDDFNAAVLELDGTEVDMPADRFTESELEELKISVADVAAIYDFIAEG